MVKIGDNTFLTVNDRKNSQKKDQPATASTKPRFGIITVEKKWVSFENLYVKYPLTMNNMPPSDLEASCALPSRSDEVLVAESGFFKGKYGRVFHMRLKEKKHKWKGDILSAFEPLSRKDSTYTTSTSEHIEGMACIETVEKELIVILATRGRKENRGKFIWGVLKGLEKGLPVFTKLGETRILEDQHSFGIRDASDLYLKKLCDKEWQVWTIAVDDPGEDFGPFRSVIYSPGTFEWDDDKQALHYQRTEPIIAWKRDGVKVEALAAPAERVKDSILSMGTEDEALGGIWQPLFPMN